MKSPLKRLSKRDWLIIETAMLFIEAGEFPFDEDPEEESNITPEEFDATLQKVIDRT